MRFTLVYIFESDKKRHKFMDNANQLLELSEFDRTYQYKMKGIKDGREVYELLDILTHYPDDPNDNYSNKVE